MNIEQFKALYTKTDGGHRVWSGAKKIRYKGALHYPHILLWTIIKKAPPKPGCALIKTCDEEKCISPEHRQEVRQKDLLKQIGYQKGNHTGKAAR